MRINPSTYLVLTVNGTAEEHFKFFPYLGSIVIIDGGDLRDVHTHTTKANGAFVQLYPVWR